MAYTLPAWTNSPSTTTPLSAANLALANNAINDLDSRAGVLELARFNVKAPAYGATGNGVTDDTTAINAAVTAAAAAGGGVVFFPPGTYIISAPIVGRDKVRFLGAGQTVTTLKARSTFAPTVSDGGGLIQWQGAPFDLTAPGTIFTYVGVADMKIDMSLAPDTVTNQINAIWQDYSQLRHCLIERVAYVGAKNGQGILLNGLGRITGGNSYDITIRDISATNGAGTVSLYLNAVTDATATYHGVTIDNIWNEITTISGIVDDRICIAGGHVSDAGSSATVHDITVSNTKTVIQTGATVTGLVNGVKIDTGRAVNIRNVTIRDTYMWGNGSTTVSGHPIITFLGAQTGTLGGLQDILIDGVYAWHTCGVAVKWRRIDNNPHVIIRNVHLNGVVTGSTGWPFGMMLYCLSAPVGDELVLVDGVSMDATSGSMTAFGLCSDTPNSGTAHGASGLTTIKNAVVKSFATGISLAKDAAGSAATQSGWNNVSLADVQMVSYTTAANMLAKAYRARNVTGVAGTTDGVHAADYGAIGDNSTDDTTALQNALTAVATNGVLHLTAGKTYRITAALTGLSNRAIDGHGATIRQATTSANALTGVDVVNFSLRDITIAGATDSSPASTGKGISITRSSRPDTFRVNLERVIVHSHGGDGIDISNPITSHFENVEVRNCGGHGFNIHGVSGGAAGTSVVFAGTYANTNLKAGFRLDTMAYCSFVGAAADGNGIGYEVVACQAISFSGCGAEAQLNNNATAAGYAGYSWKITGGYGVTLTGCWAYAQPAIALWITGSAQAVVATGFIENSPTGTATRCIQTDSGVSSTLIHNSNVTANNLSGLDLIVHDGGGLSVPGYGYFAGALTSAPATLTDAATIATNAALGNTFRVTLGGNRTLGNPTNPTNGQVCRWELIQDATGSRTLALGAAFALGTTITSTTLTTTANARDFLTAIYNSTTSRWYVIDFVKGY